MNSVDITVAPGTITVLIGPSGSGKTTLLRALSLLDPPDTGSITVGSTTHQFLPGKDVKIRPPWPNVTAVFQQLFLWPHMTLRQNITLPLNGKKKQQNIDYFNELIQLFDMASFIDRYPNEASLGQRQRAALVRALVLNPSFLLLDEVTSALDIEQVSKILLHLQTLCDKGVGILLITHLIGFARKAGDQIVFLEDGYVLESGGPELIDYPQHTRVKKFLSVMGASS